MPFVVQSQLVTTPSANATFLVNQLIGPGVVASNATLTTLPNAAGTFNGAASNIGLPSGVILTSGDVANAVGPNLQGGITTAHGGPQDFQLSTLTAPDTTEDACALEFDLVATCDTIQISYVFGSDEYDEFVCSDFNDAFAFFISGPGIAGVQNIALIPGTNIPVQINSINIGNTGSAAFPPFPASCDTTHAAFFSTNNGGASVEYDGFTVPLVAKSHVMPCSTYHIKLVIADVGDDSFDSGVFLEEGGIRCASAFYTVQSQTNNASSTAAIEGCIDGIFTFHRDGDTTNAITLNYSVGGTATPGVDYTALSGSITYPANSSTATINFSAFADGLAEGPESILLILTDTVCGILSSDTAFIEIHDEIAVDAGPDQTICFGDSAALGGLASPIETYSWTPTVGLSNPNILNPNASPPNLGPNTYIVTVQDTNLCVGHDTVIITTTPGPVATFTAPLNICSSNNGTVTFTGNAPSNATYTWNFGGGTVISGTGQGPYQVNWPTAGQALVTLVVQDGNCLSQIDSFFVSIAPPPTITLNANDLNCNGIPEGEVASAITNGTSAFTYAWSTGASTPNITGLAAGPYTLTVSDALGCQDTATIVVNQPSPLTNNLSFTPILCFGGTTTISTNAGGGSGSYTYLWSNGATTPSVTVSAGNYTVTVTDANSGALPCQIVNSIVVTEPNQILANLVPSNATCGLNNGMIGTTISGGLPPFNYAWSNGGVGSPLTGLGPGTYDVTITDANGCTVVKSTSLTQSPSPIATAGPAASFCEGEGGVQISVTGSSGTPGYYYTWWCATPPCGLDSINDNDPIANPNSSQWYYVQITDFAGCQSNIDSVFVTVLPKPIVDAGPDLWLCGDSAPCQILTPVISNAPGPYTYNWMPSVGLNNTTILNPCARPDTTTIYALVVTSGNGCTSDYTTTDTLASVTVHVNPIPIADAGPDLDICLGDSAELQGIGYGAGPVYEYQWSPSTGLSNNAIANPHASPAITTNYTLVVTSNHCPSYGDSVVVNVHTLPTVDAGWDREICLGSETQLDGSASGDSTATYSFQWTPATGIIGSGSVEDPIVGPSATTTYYLHATSNYGCESAADSVLVTLIPTPIADAGLSPFICKGDSIQLGAAFGYTTTAAAPISEVYFAWTPTYNIDDTTLLQPTVWPDSSMVYYLEIRHRECRTYDSVLVTVGPEVVASATADTTVICGLDSVQLFSTGSIGTSFQWSPNGTLSDPLVANPMAWPSVTTTYYLMVEEGVCYDSSSVTIEVLPQPESAFDNSTPAGCAPLLVSFSEASSNGTFYTWNFGDGSPVSNLPQVEHLFEAPGTYNVSLTTVAPGGCTDTDAHLTVVVGENTMADFTSNPPFPVELALPNTEVVFTDQSKGAQSWVWDFGDGIVSQEINPIHNFTAPGTYFVSLKVRSSEGCFAEVSHGPYVVVNPDLFIPNVFSPNGDGVNDYYLVDYTGSQRFLLQVFDRWGVMTYQSNNKTKGWDGTNAEGLEVPEGIYYYLVKTGDREFSGSITLVR